MELTYSNPRMEATIDNWPSGSKRVTAHFEVEQTPKGERAVRTTTGAPKKLTYAKMMRIVDGSDGHTYIAEYTIYEHITIMRGDMKYAQESIFPDDPRYAMALELFA
jgi:Neuraminidase (sialidase)